MCTQHNLWQNHFQCCFYFPNEVGLYKVINNIPQPSWNDSTTAPCHSGIQGGAPVPTEALSQFQGPWKLSSGWEARSENIYREDSQKVSQDGASEDITNDPRMGPRSRVWIEVLKGLAGVRLSPMPVTPQPRNSWPAPEWAPLRHSGTAYGCTLSHRMWQIVQQLSFWHLTKQNSWVAFVLFCEGQNEKQQNKRWQET